MKLGGLFSTIIILAISVWILIKYTNPNFKTIEDLKSGEIAKLEDVKVNYNSLKNKLDEKKESYQRSISKELEEEIDKQIIPSFIDNIRLLIAINKLLLNYNLSEDQISFSIDNFKKNQENDGLKEFILSFSFEIDYNNFKNILTDIELSKKILEIETLNITNASGGDENNSDNINVNLDLKTFWY